MQNHLNAVLLAAGEGKRMKSETPKVLCEVLMKPMIDWVVDAVSEAGVFDMCSVVGYGAEEVKAHLSHYCGIKKINMKFAEQTERLGTGHAVMQAVEFLKEQGTDGHTLILCGDAPFIMPQDIQAALERHLRKDAAATIISAKLPDPRGYGRIMRKNAAVCGIVEEKDCTQEQRTISEVNSGAYWFKTDALIKALGEIENKNVSSEYYLTDTIGILFKKGEHVESFAADPDVVLGANDRKTLMKLNMMARERIIDRHLENGVEILVPDGILIAPDVIIGAGTRILPGTILKGSTVIGSGCVIGPNSEIENCTVGDYTTINSSKCTDSVVGHHVRFGPYSQLRPNCKLDDYVKVGDFVEVKNSTLGQKTSIAHLTYVGDSDVGARVNFGCGCVTVNYDGVHKARCTIGDDCFIGCNTNLVAPVKVGDGAYTAAGTTVTREVPAGALAVGRVRQENKEGWAVKKMVGKKKK